MVGHYCLRSECREVRRSHRRRRYKSELLRLGSPEMLAIKLLSVNPNAVPTSISESGEERNLLELMLPTKKSAVKNIRQQIDEAAALSQNLTTSRCCTT
eukprot:6189351-Pleurochrysis_carterae.AAC.1